MPAGLRETARTFLVEEQLLTPEEAEQALAVAATVLGQGLDRLADATTTAAVDACASAAHALKGNLLNLGLGEPAQAAARLEALARAGDMVAARAAATTLTRVLSPLLY